MTENLTKASRVRRLAAGATAVVHHSARPAVAADPPAAPPKPDARPKPTPPRPAAPPKPTATPDPTTPGEDSAAGAKAAAKPATAQAPDPARKTAARKPPAAKPSAKLPAPTAGRTAGPTAGRTASTNGAGAALIVRADEKPWTAGELAEVRLELDAEVVRHEGEITDSERDLAELLRDSGEGAGEDQADSGTKTFEREHEMSLANNSRDMLLQSFRARSRMDDGTYGICETCAEPIGKARLQAFPRATLCVRCKQREERR